MNFIAFENQYRSSTTSKIKCNYKENNINTLRYYGFGAQIIKDLNLKNMILISRSKKKIIGLEGFGLKIKKQIIKQCTEGIYYLDLDWTPKSPLTNYKRFPKINYSFQAKLI